LLFAEKPAGGIKTLTPRRTLINISSRMASVQAR
jgi:hypothetical protein